MTTIIAQDPSFLLCWALQLGSLLPGKAYAFFSHTHKAQPDNMPLLDEVRPRHRACASPRPCPSRVQRVEEQALDVWD